MLNWNHHFQDFNADPSLLASDYLTANHFRRPDILDPNMIPVSVVIIDSLWQTRLFMQPGAIQAITDNLRNQWQTITVALEELRQIGLPLQLDQVCQYANNLFRVILEIQNLNINYSFATKLFHWLSPNCFPIVDSRVRIAISAFQVVQMQQGTNIPHEDRISPYMPDGGVDGRLNDYKKFLLFYSRLINSIPVQQREELIQSDFDSQKRRNQLLAIENSLLRVLDKDFYMKGGNQ